MKKSTKYLVATGGGALAVFAIYKAIDNYNIAQDAKEKAAAAAIANPGAMIKFEEAEKEANQMALIFGGVAVLGLGVATIALWPK